MRVVTYSRNIFIPLTDLCSNKCGYCSFWRHPEKGRVIKRREALDLIVKGAESGCSEALISMGQSPWKVHGFSRIMSESGPHPPDLMDYLIEICELALEWGLLPHVNAGLLSHEYTKRISPYCASMGLMLETTAELPAHSQSPAKRPDRRISFLAMAGKLKIPFTTGIMVGIGEEMSDRVASLRAIAGMHKKFHNIQEVIVQPFDPKLGTPMERKEGPKAEDIKETVRLAREILPGQVAIQVPPNLVDPGPMVEAGADDLGGISPVTPDWINPGKSWPALASLHLNGCSLRERLAVYPRYVLDGWFGKKTEGVVMALADSDGLRRRSN